MRARKFAAAVILVLAFAVSAPVGAEVYSGEPINIELADADLEVVLANFSELTGYAFVVDPRTAAQGGLDQRVDALYQETPWDQIVDEILTAAGLEWTLEGKIMWIHLPGAGPLGDRNFTGDQIRLRLQDADIRAVLSNFSKITGYNIDVAPDVQGTVTLRLESVPWDQVLDFVLTISGLTYEINGGTISVHPVTDARGRQLLTSPV
jgi:type II secretory pathway component HofQ